MSELGYIIGFTGSRNGMSDKQKEGFSQVINNLGRIKEFRHGDCVGSDANAHSIVKEKDPNNHVIGHPTSYKKYRAFCKCDIFLKPGQYLDRNKAIVDSSEILIATPNGPEKLRSGTWSTIRYARRKALPIYIITLDGKVIKENIKAVDSVDSDSNVFDVN